MAEREYDIVAELIGSRVILERAWQLAVDLVRELGVVVERHAVSDSN